MTEQEKITLTIKLDQHRTETFLTCPEDCWCWDKEISLMKEEKENDLR